ncbi:hypothetical protein DFO45_3267 [Azorhizobium sp. AG788]|uniref:hypothetical protein n=1 Tax=Azorhizobium sp. AG788 TaxID=2183897 RepID=UPI0010620095|nr:hypothetical protein [Azorhizobium sp. AG788]TDT92510.1 hypothetical protein DFO45_3267 [Azorhizobium sp. AG788]
MSKTLFSAYDLTLKVKDEGEYLMKTLESAFIARDFEMHFEQPINGDEDVNFGGHYSMKSKALGRRHYANIAFFLDLHREVCNGDWEHGKSSLFSFGFSPVYEEGWFDCGMRLSSNGQLTLEGTEEESSHYKADSSGYLIEFVGPEVARPKVPRTKHLNTRTWMFSVPLEALHNREAAISEIVDPAVAMIIDGKLPKVAFKDRSAVIFPS